MTLQARFALLLWCLFCGALLGNKEDIEDMFALAQHVHSMGTKNNTAEMASLVYPDPLRSMQLIRVPKASSTSLSVVARRMVGCSPPGPCCKFPGDPPGSCPRRELFACETQFKVIGCTGHHVDYRALLDAKVRSITILREPRSRALSAYFYPGHHHNSDCRKGLLPCFEDYLVDARFRNVATKMFAGEYAYAPARTCASSRDCKFSLERAQEALQSHFAFVGVAEMWELSLVVLHRKFPWFAPDRDEFGLSEGTSDSEKLGAVAGNVSAAVALPAHRGVVRINRDATYLDFKNMALARYAAALLQQSALDVQLYAAALQRLCRELHALHLWRLKKVQRYWRSRLPAQYAASVDQCR